MQLHKTMEKQEKLKEPINYPNALSRSLNNRVVKKEEPKQDRTCNNNCSVVCGECQIFEPKQETLEKAKAKLFRYSEEEVYIIVSDLLRKCQTGSIKDFRDVEDWFNKIKKK